LAPADALEAVLLEEAEQLALQLGREVAHLVQEDRAAARGLEPPRLVLPRAGEGALHVSEEFALERCSARLVHEMVTNGPAWRGLQACMAAASTFFPVPLSPVSSRVASEAAAWRAVASARAMAGLADSSSAGSSSTRRSARFSRRSACTSSTRARRRPTCSSENGFTR